MSHLCHTIQQKGVRTGVISMRYIDVLVTTELADGMAPFMRGDINISFSKWSGLDSFPTTGERLRMFIDWTLPQISGLEVCRRIRCHPATTQAHVTMVLEDDEQQARSTALRAGADDYMPGPLNRQDLLTRILSAEDHDMGRSRSELVFGNLIVDVAAFRAKYNGRTIHLMPNEFRLLQHFVEHPGRVFTRSQLMAALGKQVPQLDERTVDVWVGRLRRAMRSASTTNTVRTVRSRGYILDTA